MTDKPPMPEPECPFCGAKANLRLAFPAIDRYPAEWICEDCFIGADDGPCFDDLPDKE